jgi:GH24 family phage-related lysozyme (muramidase)
VLLDGKLPNVRDLPPDCYGALLSLVFNRGAAFEAQGERFTEMRNIQGLMQSKQFDGIPAQIRAMKRLWPSTGLATRREQEAKLCEKGLAPGDALTSR